MQITNIIDKLENDKILITAKIQKLARAELIRLAISVMKQEKYIHSFTASNGLWFFADSDGEFLSYTDKLIENFMSR